MLENTVPTRRVKQRGSFSKILIGDPSTQVVVNEKNTNGLTRGRMASQKLLFFPVPSR